MSTEDLTKQMSADSSTHARAAAEECAPYLIDPKAVEQVAAIIKHHCFTTKPTTPTSTEEGAG